MPLIGSVGVFDISWAAIESRLLEIAEQGEVASTHNPEDSDLESLGLVRRDGERISLTELGESYYQAAFVLQSGSAIRETLQDILVRQPVVTSFCGTLWREGDIKVSGAVSFLKRITGSGSDKAAKRWLALMNTADLIDYNRNKPTLRVKYNADGLVPPEDDLARQRKRSYVIAPERPFGNLLALKDLLASTQGSLRWYEQHLPVKVLEVLYRELDGERVNEVRLLSGPANLGSPEKKEFKRFADEMMGSHGLCAAWSVLDKATARGIHDRFFISEGQSRNLPPLNTILAGSTGEILDSDVGAEQFDTWWDLGTPLQEWNPST